MRCSDIPTTRCLSGGRSRKNGRERHGRVVNAQCHVPRHARWLLLCACLGFAGCDGTATGLGERIYRDGRGEQGELTYRLGPRWLAHGTFGCATCHGEDGQGRFVQAGRVAGSAPPVTRSALRDRGYDVVALRRAIVDGVAVDGRALGHYMPRWQISEHELQALLDHLAEL